ncbi:ACP S-malonyltransferase [Gynuella sunshinyii]|uniref:[acyl-carrier-protein] S-malonyltransferase n=1 Tax=Gynuella sunshinyii YC6258 TaxID=1445510 RepID=A0A0C5V8J6_9GAMM|nr:ACP S-malonyltransferase [Gynuella sunshinyii]AJQ95700.1 (acyl-carrier-protein) S-malonyltransferase [Gynuella sunshinyii YC6258]
MKTFVFPGQGSQAKGMGGNLFDEFKDLVDKADAILGFSIKQLCLEDPNKELNKTQFTQPALYVVNALSYYKKISETGQKPDFVAGHSLGEFNALLAAECFDFETGLKLVKKRGELMSQVSDGGMAAVLNVKEEDIKAKLAGAGLDSIDLANFNTYAQIVISGPKQDILKAADLFNSYHPLNTSGAFHSRYMMPVKEQFASYLKEFSFSNQTIPVISNVTAQPYQNDKIHENLANQLVSCVRWADSIRYLIGQKNGTPMEFEEIGHGTVLTRIISKVKDEVKDMPSVETSKAQPDPVAPPQETKPTNTSKSDNHNQAEQKVLEWNKKYPVGTKVKSTVMDYDNLETRTEAMVLFGHRAAVYMKDYNGYFDLDEVVPV